MSEPGLHPPLARGDVSVRLVELELPADWPDDGFGALSAVYEALPTPTAGRRGDWIALRGAALGRATLLSRLRRRRPEARPHPALVGTALLARGYEEICTDDAGITYGRSPG